MTIKSYTAGSLALSEIQTEFGGSNPIGLDEYYAGGSYVNSGTLGYPNGSAVAIPSSGPISIQNFYGASAEPNALTLANYFWNNRANLVRYATTGGGLSYYPGDNYALNTYGFRYVGSYTNSWNFYNSGLPITSAFYTALSIAYGAIGNYGGITSVSTSPGTLIADPAVFTSVTDGPTPSIVDNGFGISVKLQVFQGQINAVTSHSITSAHSGGNRGAWSNVYLIPGKWGFKSGSVSYNFDDFSYTPTLGSGEIHVIALERGGDYNNPIPAAAGSTNNMSVNNWWYNAGGSQVSVNTTSSSQTLDWSSYGGYFSGMTPRVAGILQRFY